MAGPEAFNFVSRWLKKLVIRYWFPANGSAGSKKPVAIRKRKAASGHIRAIGIDYCNLTVYQQTALNVFKFVK
jgi:hypothetical protein